MAYDELDFTKNGNIQTQLIAQFPTGQYNPSDPGQYNNSSLTFQTPFNISADGNGNNFYAFAAGNTTPQNVFGSLNLTNVTDVYTLLGSYHPNGGMIATFEFMGTDANGNALEQDVSLTEGTDIRDFYQGGFSNTINGTTTQNAFEAQNVQGGGGTGNVGTGLMGTYHIDEADFHFTTPFATLNNIVLVSNNGDNVLLLGATAQTACFATGTMIRTVRGETIGDAAVELLAVGDGVVTTSGACRPIRWLGHRTIDCAKHARPQEVYPIRVTAHAFGENRPARDLLVSPGHAICVDVLGEVLIPAGALVNGSTVQQVQVDEITYWHVELDSHDVLLAENLPAESYIDMGNRGFFQEADLPRSSRAWTSSLGVRLVSSAARSRDVDRADARPLGTSLAAIAGSMTPALTLVAACER